MDDRSIVFNFIDDYYRHSSRRPKMYFRGPEACEDAVVLLEQLRDTLIDGERVGLSRYIDYTISKGVGPLGHYRQYVIEHPGASVDEDLYYAAFFELLQGYLAGQGRTLSGPGDEMPGSSDDLPGRNVEPFQSDI